MITQLQLIAPVQLPASVAAQLTTPAYLTYRIGRAAFSNPTAAAIAVSAYLVPAGGAPGASNQILDALVVAAGSTYVSPELSGLVLPAGATLQCFAAIAGALVLYASGVSITSQSAGGSVPAGTLSPPSIAPPSGAYASAASVSITGVSGAPIYYTVDGSTPTTSSTVYTGPLSVTASQTVNAIQAQSGIVSAVASAAYTISLGLPTFFPAAGVYPSAQSVSIAGSAGATIYYTLDGSTPMTSSTVYSGPFSVSATQTVNAIQALAGAVSSVASAAYTIALAAPTFSPASGSYSSALTVTIAGLPGATIYYTADGSTPTSASTVYTGGVSVAASQTIKAVQAISGALSAVGSSAYTIATGSAALQFNFPSFNSGNLGGGSGQIHPQYGSPVTTIYGGNAISLTPAGGSHVVGAAWYVDRQTITSFTTNFTFTLSGTPNGATVGGLTFCIQNSDAAVQTSGSIYVGTMAGGDANAMGYGQYSPANPYGQAVYNSIALCFTAQNQIEGTLNTSPGYPYGASYTGLLTEGGPFNPMSPQQDLLPYGVNVANGNEMAVNLVYDGTILTMVIEDTVTLAQARFTWPLNLPPLLSGSGVGAGLPVGAGTSSTAWVGFTAGVPPQVSGDGALVLINSWNYYTGYNTRLATPTFNIASGEYSSGQTLTISGPGSIYYTTNGLLPTSASTPYTGPITLSASTGYCVNAVAIQTGFTDSLVAQGNYSIGSANVVNFPAGFAANDGVALCGVAALAGSAIQLTNNNSCLHALPGGGQGAAWYGVPVPITGNWTTTFQLAWPSATSPAANGLGFIIQNQSNVGQTYSANTALSGGPNSLLVGEAPTTGGGGPTPTTGAVHPTGVMVFFDLFNTANSVELYSGVPVTAANGGGSIGTGLTFSGNTFNVTLTFTASTNTLALSMSQVGGATFTHSWTVNIPAVVAASSYGNSAYVGFAAYCSGWDPSGFTATQAVNNWTMT